MHPHIELSTPRIFSFAEARRSKFLHIPENQEKFDLQSLPALVSYHSQVLLAKSPQPFVRNVTYKKILASARLVHRLPREPRTIHETFLSRSKSHPTSRVWFLAFRLN